MEEKEKLVNELVDLRFNIKKRVQRINRWDEMSKREQKDYLKLAKQLYGYDEKS